jgi:hypothetical protein
MDPPHPTLDQISAWSEVGILIIDEFSMVTPQMLSLLDDRLRRLKGEPKKLFGGVHVIFCGDFFQLPPVGSGPIYSHHIPNASKNSIRSSNGRQLWKTCLTDVVELQQTIIANKTLNGRQRHSAIEIDNRDIRSTEEKHSRI